MAAKRRIRRSARAQSSGRGAFCSAPSVGTRFLPRISLMARMRVIGRRLPALPRPSGSNPQAWTSHEWTPRHTNGPRLRSVTSVGSCSPAELKQEETEATELWASQALRSPASSTSSRPSRSSCSTSAPAPLAPSGGQLRHGRKEAHTTQCEGSNQWRRGVFFRVFRAFRRHHPPFRGPSCGPRLTLAPRL